MRRSPPAPGAPGTGGGETATPDPGEAMRAFGRHLHRERELRGLSLDDVARVTRLGPAVIASIESGEPDRMPARAYVFGYLRSYAAATGLDPDEVILRYQEAAGPGVVEPGAPSLAPVPRSRRQRWIVLAVLAALAVVAVAIGAWRSGRGTGEIRGRRSQERAPYRPADVP